MKEWLDKHNIAYDAMDLKRDLFSKISAVNAKTVYRTDEVAHQFGHEVVCLPIAHCEFNPIELAWSVVKRHCRTQHKSFTLKEIEDLVPNGFEQVTPAMWSNFCDHVKKVEDEYWEKDGLIEDALEEFVIRLSESDFDSSTDDNDTDTDSDTLSDDEHDVALQREEKITERSVGTRRANTYRSIKIIPPVIRILSMYMSHKGIYLLTLGVLFTSSLLSLSPLLISLLYGSCVVLRCNILIDAHARL